MQHLSLRYVYNWYTDAESWYPQQDSDADATVPDGYERTNFMN